MHGKKNSYKKFVKKPEGKRPLGSPHINGRVILESITGKQGGET
jgi:hypothetical protein